MRHHALGCLVASLLLTVTLASAEADDELDELFGYIGQSTPAADEEAREDKFAAPDAAAEEEADPDSDAEAPQVIELPADVPEPVEQRATPRRSYIEEIIVTVSKREERVQDVSNAVSAFSGSMLEENNIQDFDSLADFTPGMVTRNEESITIRGVGKARGGTSPVAFHINGFIMEGRGERFYDLSAIEVLRGPSGTVYGRNATAGAINVKWAQPELEFDAGGDIRFGNFDESEFRGFVNVPIFGDGNPLLAARVAAVKVKRNGYFDNLLSQGTEPDSVDEGFARIFLTSEPSDNLRLGLRFIDNRADPFPGVASASRETRESGILEEFGAQPLPDDLLAVRSVQYQQTDKPFRNHRRVTGELTWSMPTLPGFGDVDLDIQGGRQRENLLDIFDLDGTEEPIVETISDSINTRRSIELRLTSQNSGGFEWLMGLFWYHSNTRGNLHVDARTREGAGAAVGLLFPQAGAAEYFDQLPNETKRVLDADVDFIDQRREDISKAVFANFSADLGDLISDFPHIEVFGGLRLNNDYLHLQTEREVIYAADYETGIEIPFPIDDKSTDVEGDFDATTGELGGKWFHDGRGLMEEGMLYGKFARGYKPGTVQLLAGEGLNEVKPELLNMFEVGWKAAFLQRAIVMNLTAFMYDYTDLQVAKIIITGQKLENAGSAVISGMELELQITPSRNLYTQWSVSLLRARFNAFCGKDEEIEDQAAQPGCTDDDPHNFKGASLSDAPNISVSGLMRYEFDLGRWGKLAPAASVSWIDSYERRPYDNPIDHVPSHTKTDLRLNWSSPSERFSLEAFVENLEDHDEIFADHFSMPDPGAYSLLSVAPPRTLGLRFSLEF